MKVLECILYELHPETGAAFHALMQKESVSLHAQFGIDIVAHGQSLHQADHYFLLRAFDDAQQREDSLGKFYASEAWQTGPRAAIIAMIKQSLISVMPYPSTVIDALRDSAAD